jgi:hypothetical protein
LFGDGLLSSIGSAIGRFSGLGESSAKGLLSFLGPMILGKIASIWKGQGGTPQALTNLLASQRDHIADALPAGFSPQTIPGWPPAKEAARSTAATGRRVAAAVEPAPRSMASWAVPLALCLFGGFLLWNWMKSDREATADRSTTESKVTAMKPVTPEAPATVDVTAVGKRLNGLYDSVDKVLASIKDPESAEAALPKLKDLESQIDAARKMLVQLPASGISSVKEMANENMAKFKEQAETTLETPGLSEEIKNLITTIMRKLTELFAPATP